VVACAACKRDGDPPPPKPTAAPPPVTAAPAILEVPLGPAELLPDDGAPMNAMPIATYTKQLGSSTAVVVARSFPAGLSPAAGAGVNLQVGDQNVSWVFDRDTLIYDENANGDLRDDPKHRIDKELMLTLRVSGEITGSLVDAPVRIRKRPDGALFIQATSVRRGEIPLPAGPMKLAALGDLGHFGLDHQVVAFDLDRDGAMDLKTLDGPEQIRVFEQSVNLDDKSYAFSVEPNGDTLTLVPAAKRLPDRPRLGVGSVPPDVSLTTFDGTKLKLSDLRGKVVLIDFWATACAPCIKALPRLKEFRAKYAPKGYELVAIALPTDDVKTVLGDHGAGIEAADDAAQTAFRIDRYPTYFVLDRDGTIACSRCSLDAAEELIVKKLGG
jgi:thiol-disulfide isomerase/thioredoxin